MEFHKEIQFKDTDIGGIPKGWAVAEIGDIALEVYRYPTYYNIEYTDRGVPEIRGELIKGNGELENDMGKYRHISPETSAKFPRTVVKEGDFIISVRATMGKIGVVPKSLERANITANLMRISLDRSKCHTPFFKQVFLSQKFKRMLNLFSSETTIKTIQSPVLKSIKLPLPPLSEQQKIAEVLSIVDETIQRTEEIIQKTQNLKKGLMRKLFTEGIGHKEFKDTGIGRIPTDWRVVHLDKVAEIRNSKKVNNFDRVAFIPMELISETQISVSCQIREKKDVKSFIYCEAGDLLLAKITPSLENGKQGIVPDDIPSGFALATTEVFPIHCKEIHKFFLFYILKLSKFRNRIISSMTGTTGRLRASKKFVKSLNIPLPPFQEQQKIAEILSSVDEKIEKERQTKEQLEKLKSGLMQILLTGKVRVKVN